jgi:hypothetical protein
VVSTLREMRRSIDVSQEQFARLLGVPLETLRTWDRGRRPAPPDVHVRARQAITAHQRQHELLSLDELATEFGIHQRTTRDAVRAGRLDVHLSTRSAFGRPFGVLRGLPSSRTNSASTVDPIHGRCESRRYHEVSIYRWTTPNG